MTGNSSDRRKLQRLVQRIVAEVHPPRATVLGGAATSEPPAFLVWLRGVGAGGTLLGGLGFFQDPRFFWSAVAVFYAGLLITAVDLFFEPFFRRWSRVLRAGVCLLIAGAAFWFGQAIVAVETPLVVFASSHGGYLAGTEARNITWREEFSELLVTIKNETEHDFDGLDVLLKPNMPVATMSHVRGCPDHVIENGSNNLLTAAQRGNNLPLDLLATDAGYRLRCSRLPARGQILLALAVAQVSVALPRDPSKITSAKVDPRDLNNVITVTNTIGNKYWWGYQGATRNHYAPRVFAETLTVESQYVAAWRERIDSQTVSISAPPSRRRLSTS